MLARLTARQSSLRRTPQRESRMESIDFLLTGNLSGFFFNPHRRDGLTFTSGPPKPLLLTVRPENPEKDDSGLMFGLRYRVVTTRTVAPEIRTFVKQLINRRFHLVLDSSIKLPLVKNNQVRIDAEGNVAEGFSVPFELYPADLQTLCDDVSRELSDGVLRFFKLLRWQQEIDAPHDVFGDFKPALYWKVSGETYSIVGFRRQGGNTIRSPAGITWTDEDERDFTALWVDPSAEEPLAHELLREAKAALTASPRSALLMTATALETGVKTHIAKLVPDARWLLSEMPSPPIHKMLRKYLPELHQKRGTALANWAKLKPLFKDAENLAEHRNDLTHTGDMPGEVHAALPKLINSVSDLLYILDVLEGRDWAKQCVGLHSVGNKIAQELGWPRGTRKRYFATISVG